LQLSVIRLGQLAQHKAKAKTANLGGFPQVALQGFMKENKLISAEDITEHHAETYLTIKKKHGKEVLEEFLSIFTKPAICRIKKLAENVKPKI
jgi:hypothetical protein